LYPFWHQVSTAADRFGPADFAAFGDHIEANGENRA
jgi:hypothetical protein